MANAYFTFKQFTVKQDKCGMKVCTDACLFGAWVASLLQKSKIEAENLLDIGSGTGLLSLMLAQKSNAKIIAIDIDNAAAIQSKENFEASPWHHRLKIVNKHIEQFVPEQLFDFIICNPPFFKNDIPSINAKNKIARHEGSLTLKTILGRMAELIEPVNGKVAILLPYHRLDELKQLVSESGLCIYNLMKIRQSVSHGYFRLMALMGRDLSRECTEEEISIRDAEEKYTDAFSSLLKDYYLYL